MLEHAPSPNMASSNHPGPWMKLFVSYTIPSVFIHGPGSLLSPLGMWYVRVHEGPGSP